MSKSRKKKALQTTVITSIPISEISGLLSTAQAAKLIGVSKSTLLRWLSEGSMGEPQRISVAGVPWRVWAENDIVEARRVKATMRPGPKSKKKK